MMNRKLVDELAVEFCMTHNTKLSRKKLARFLYAVEKNRWAPLLAAQVPSAHMEAYVLVFATNSILW